MKKYNIDNYIKYKNDLSTALEKVDKNFYSNRDNLIIKYTPLVEKVARRFSTRQEASGVLSIDDFIQEGTIGLIKGVDKIDWELVNKAPNPNASLESFLTKRIKGAIRRGIDIHRGNMRIPEYKLNEIRKNTNQDKKVVEMFFNSIFLSIDNNLREDNPVFEIPDKSEEYNTDILNKYILSIMEIHLNIKEFDILRMSYGLDCDKMSAKDIAEKLSMKEKSAHVRVSQIKKEAIQKLVDNVDPSQVADYL
jgi:RNA polymerase sigma factor (sigma-70 family)|tara:strand:- start:3047 stop:3796 length:750 start_codon:yes stop_codon:yes gene_type:complete